MYKYLLYLTVLQIERLNVTVWQREHYKKSFLNFVNDSWAYIFRADLKLSK